MAVREDGCAVSHQSWGSGQTRDLVRHLALENNRPVRTSTIIATLWPAVSESRARASLRRSASWVRRLLSRDCIIRAPGAMVLTGCWVDTESFRTSSRGVQAAMADHDPVQALVSGGEAGGLYRGDFQAHADDSEWAVRERASLQGVRHEMLTDAATCAIETGGFREAVRYATLAIDLDGSAQSAHLSLIRAHAELGDVHRSLAVYETYRVHLAEDYGADPSHEAQELHLSVLRGHFD
ncbi:hypothetical protein BH11ACT8_BH11ACT8_10900 [soil metagenome]